MDMLAGPMPSETMKIKFRFPLGKDAPSPCRWWR